MSPAISSLRADQPAVPASPRWNAVAYALIAAACLALVALKSAAVYRERVRPELDELAYLELANDVAESGGWAAFLPNCLRGEYREANRQPLYLLTLGTWAERDPSFYPRAKLVSWWIGLATTAVILGIALRSAGPPGTVCVALLLAHNDLWLTHMATVGVEMLLFLWLTLAWLVLAHAGRSTARHAFAGILLGLAYWTKATALIAVLAYGVAVLATERHRIVRYAPAWSLLAAWIVVVAPLVVRNVELYASPFYNVNAHYMWLDDWSDVALVDEADIPSHTLWTFLDRRGAAVLALRALNGLARESAFLLTALGVRNERVSATALASGGLVLAIAALGLRRLPSPAARWFTGWTVFGFVAALALHAPHASHPRFQLTSLPILYCLAALELAGLAAARCGWPRRAWQSPRLHAALAGVVATLAAVACLHATQAGGGQGWWMPVYEPPAAERELAEWLREHVRAGETIAIAQDADFSPFWYTKMPQRGRGVPVRLSAESFETWAAGQGIRYAVIDRAHPPRWAASWSATSGGWLLEKQAGPLAVYRHPSP